MVYEERHGNESDGSFTKSPPAGARPVFLLVCVKCTATSDRLDSKEVELLAQGTIPQSIHEQYPPLQTLYNPTHFDQQKRRNMEKMSSESAERIDCLVRHYQLES
jgi:hypothetical protein